ncbi:glycogen/starch synthase [Akkermansiaceae bacterium]|nr:glycogen/starch synthase [Akkermansiaceae bacterium]MDA7519842.1 glycogen/starch synthase [bacterium]MDA7674877.1 glycogen/starch synthase [Akkermansiaceae bacterium]MDB4041502.1 glycogen/starch synthase [Akkermansiaceae bacterium]MDB4275637.1 glycogen/starch synthase [Akkermansiaceae bacterium]
MSSKRKKPTILVVTPEITYLPKGMGNAAQRLSAKAGGMADVSASLVNALYEQGADVHVALPNFRRMFNLEEQNVYEAEYHEAEKALPEQHIHLAQDRIFFHRSRVYSAKDNHNMALAFQREVINHTIPQVRPDLIHCNDWMTGLIPAVAKRHGIKSLFTLHNIHTERLPLSQIEDRGIDAADFWKECYYMRQPHSYEETRESNHVDLLTTGIFASDHVNSVSPTFLSEVVDGRHSFVPSHINHELWQKCQSGNASGILNAPDVSFCPTLDPHLEHHYSVEDHPEGKAKNKAALQQALGLKQDPNAPVLLWPSRLDPVQKGTELFSHIIHMLTEEHADLQIAIVASGEFKKHFLEIIEMHQLAGRVALVDFTEPLSRLGYAGSDFMIMPSRFEPCGLPQMVSPKYGTLPIAHDTGGIHDTVDPFNYDNDSGNGFLFQHYTPEGLHWSINEAINFHRQSAEVKKRHISRIMVESASRFNHENTARDYIELYERMLGQSVTD